MWQKEKLLNHDEQILLLSQCFQNSSASEALESVYVWERGKASEGSHNIFHAIMPDHSRSFNIEKTLNPFPHMTNLQQTTLNIFVKKWKISIIEWITNDLKWKTLWQKEKLLIMSNFFFCYNVFKSRLLQKVSVWGKGLIEYHFRCN